MLKPEQILEAFKYAGFDPEKIETVDAFKTAFDGEFVRKSKAAEDKDIINAIIGRRVGTIDTKIKAVAKANGIDFTADDLKDKKIEDIIELGFNRFAEMAKKSNDAIRVELGSGKDEQIKGWESKYAEQEKRLQSELKIKGDLATDYDNYKKQVAEDKKTGKIKEHAEKAWSDYKWGNGITELTKEGFKSKMNSLYKLNLDDKGEIYASDVNGERIKSPSKSGEVMNYADILQMEGSKPEYKVYAAADNKGDGKQAGGQRQQFQQQIQTEVKTGEVFVHPSAMKAAQGQR